MDLTEAMDHTCGYECRAVEGLLESLTDDHGDGEPIEPTPTMLRAARVFVHRVMRDLKGGDE